MADYYILDEDRQPIPVDDGLTWGKWFETADRRVAQDYVGDKYVSTVFLGINHQFGDGPPLIFETMAFGKDWGDELGQERYSTWEEAEAGHKAMVERIKEDA